MKKIKHECNRDILDKKRKLAIAIFKDSYPKYADICGEDFGSVCVEEWLLGRSQKTDIRKMAIDYIRTLGTPASSIKKGFDQSIRGVDVMRMEPLELKITHYKTSAPSRMPDYHAADLINSNLLLNRQERATLIMYYHWDFKLEEIAYMFGLSGSAITLCKQAAEQKIKIQCDIDEGNET